MVAEYAFHFDCMAVNRASDSMTAPTYFFTSGLVPDDYVVGPALRGLTLAIGLILAMSPHQRFITNTGLNDLRKNYLFDKICVFDFSKLALVCRDENLRSMVCISYHCINAMSTQLGYQGN